MITVYHLQQDESYLLATRVKPPHLLARIEEELDHAYRETTHIEASWIENKSLALPAPRNSRSSSVGDIFVAEDGRQFLVDRYGFILLAAPWPDPPVPEEMIYEGPCIHCGQAVPACNDLRDFAYINLRESYPSDMRHAFRTCEAPFCLPAHLLPTITCLGHPAWAKYILEPLVRRRRRDANYQTRQSERMPNLYQMLVDGACERTEDREDAADVALARERLAAGEPTIPWEEVKKELDL